MLGTQIQCVSRLHIVNLYLTHGALYVVQCAPLPFYPETASSWLLNVDQAAGP